MTTVLLVRHGRTKANADGVLAGWTPGVLLDEKGEQQAVAVGQRLAPIPLAAVIASPLERTQQTADAICAAQSGDPARHIDDAVGECHYGEWTGQPLKALAKSPLWSQVQSHPSAVTFPGGESMLQMQQRAVLSIRSWNDRLGEAAVYVVVSHGDVIKSVLADALGMHLDQFQRIVVDPCSVSVIEYTKHRPFVVRSNDLGSDLSGLAKKPKAKGRRGSDAAVGGGKG